MDYLLNLLFLLVIWGHVLAYLALQLYAPVRCKGWWRGAALIPLLVMIPVIWITVVGYNKQSNLWPILLIMASYVVVPYLAVLVFYQRKKQNAREPVPKHMPEGNFVNLKKWPVGVRIICAYVAYSTIGYVVSLGMLTSNVAQETAQNMSMSDQVIAAAIALVFASGGIALFRLKRIALPIFVVSLALDILSSVYNMLVKPDLFEWYSKMLFFPLAISPIIKVTIIIYCLKLIQENVLD